MLRPSVHCLCLLVQKPSVTDIYLPYIFYARITDYTETLILYCGLLLLRYLLLYYCAWGVELSPSQVPNLVRRFSAAPAITSRRLHAAKRAQSTSAGKSVIPSTASLTILPRPPAHVTP